MTKRITKAEAIGAIEKALEKQIDYIDSFDGNRSNPIINKCYHRACGMAEAYLNVLDVLKLNTFITINI